MTLDINKYDAFAPNLVYAANTVPDMVANPPAITACISDAVKY